MAALVPSHETQRDPPCERTTLWPLRVGAMDARRPCARDLLRMGTNSSHKWDFATCRPCQAAGAGRNIEARLTIVAVALAPEELLPWFEPKVPTSKLVKRADAALSKVESCGLPGDAHSFLKSLTCALWPVLVTYAAQTSPFRTSECVRSYRALRSGASWAVSVTHTCGHAGAL